MHVAVSVQSGLSREGVHHQRRDVRKQKGLILPPGFGDEEEVPPPEEPPPSGGSTPWTANPGSQWQLVFADNFDTVVAEGAMFARSGDHARGLGAYSSK